MEFNKNAFDKWVTIGLNIIMLYGVVVAALLVFNMVHHRSMGPCAIAIDTPGATAKR